MFGFLQQHARLRTCVWPSNILRIRLFLSRYNKLTLYSSCVGDRASNPISILIEGPGRSHKFILLFIATNMRRIFSKVLCIELSCEEPSSAARRMCKSKTLLAKNKMSGFNLPWCLYDVHYLEHYGQTFQLGHSASPSSLMSHTTWRESFDHFLL